MPGYDAFLSYSHAADSAMAADVQNALQRFATPWYRRRPFLRVQRDETSFGAGTELSSTLQSALDDSEHLIVLLSPEAAASTWTDQEIRYWLETREKTAMTFAVTRWGADTAGEPLSDLGALDWAGTDLPFSLRGVFEEPLMVDLRWATDPSVRTLENEQFRDAIAEIAAAVRGQSKDEFIGAYVTMRHRARIITGAVALGLGILALALGLSLFMWDTARGAADSAKQDQADAEDATRLAKEATQLAEHAERVADEAAKVANEARSDADAARDAAVTARDDARAESATAQAGAETAQAEKAAADAAAAQALDQQRTAEVAATEAEALAAQAEASAEAAAAEAAVAKAIAAEAERTAARAQSAQADAEEATARAVDGQEKAEEGQKKADEAKKIADRLAESQRGITNMLDLVSQTSAVFPTDLSLGSLLAVEAYRLQTDLASTAKNELAESRQARVGEFAVLRSLSFEPQLVALLIGSFLDVVFSPDGATFATLTSSVIRLSDVADLAKPPRELRLVGSSVVDVVFSPDGATLAVMTSKSQEHSGDSVRLWDVTDVPKPIQNVHDDFGDGATDLVFSPDGATLATLSADSVQLWDAADLTKPPRKMAPDARFPHVVFSPDSDTLATLSATLSGDSVQLWDAADLTKPPRKLALDGRFRQMVFSPDSDTLAATVVIPDDIFLPISKVQLWDVADLTKDPQELLPRDDLPAQSFDVTDVVFSPDGDTVAATVERRDDSFDASGNTVRLWEQLWDVADLTNVLSIGDIPHNDVVTRKAFSLDGSALAGVSRHASSSEGSVRVWDVEAWPPQGALVGDDRVWARVAFSPDGETLATISSGTVRLWDAADLTRTPQNVSLPNPCGDGGPVDVAFSPDGETLATISSGTVQLWDAADLTNPPQNVPNPTPDDFTFPVGVVFSPDGEILGTSWWSDFNFVLLSNVADVSKRIPSVHQDFGTRATGLVFSPDRETLATTSGKTVQLWNGADWTKPPQNLHHDFEIEALAFSPNGETLATGGPGLGLWVIGDAAEAGPFAEEFGGNLSGVNAMAFSPDGTKLATGEPDGVRLWELDPEEWKERACARAGRNMTQAEWDQYRPGVTYSKTCTGFPGPE